MVRTYQPKSESLKEYMKNMDDLWYFEYIIENGTAEFKQNNSVFLETFEKEGGEEDLEAAEFLKKTKAKGYFLMHFVRRQSFIFQIHIFEYFLMSLIREIYLHDIRPLKTQEKKLDYETLLSFSDMAELKNGLIEREVFALGNQSYLDIDKYFKQKFKIDISKKKMEKIDELFHIRNILVHNNGIVDKTFVDRFKKGKYKIGKKVYIDATLLERTHRVLTASARTADEEVYKKFLSK